MVGTGLGAQNGILIKNTRSLQVAHKINALVFDKTGTLTKGKPQVTDIIGYGKSKENVLSFAACVEKRSEHPLGEALLEEARKNKLDLPEVKSFEAIAGKGVSAVVEGNTVLIGSGRLMKEKNIDISISEIDLDRLGGEGKTVMLVAVNNSLIGVIAVADVLKEFSKAAAAVLDIGPRD